MSDEIIEEQPVQTKKQKTKADKQAEHIERIKRTLVASLIGIFVGGLSYYIGISYSTDSGLLALMLMIAGIVIQKHIFMLLHMDTQKLGAKDWFYQGFMTFAFWYMTWTILLTAMPK
jgi:heme/copper-type cytochrome/quinol oxidase subunit 4